MPNTNRIFVAKEAFKFSCAHMTVFPDGTKERLHGHNYQVQVELELERIGFADLLDFGALKAAIAELCAAWKERLILAERNPHLEWVREGDDEVEFRLAGKRYVVPAEDVLRLPIENATVEQLAATVCDLLVDRLPKWPIRGIDVTVLESPGQGATHSRLLE